MYGSYYSDPFLGCNEFILSLWPHARRAFTYASAILLSCEMICSGSDEDPRMYANGDVLKNFSRSSDLFEISAFSMVTFATIIQFC